MLAVFDLLLSQGQAGETAPSTFVEFYNQNLRQGFFAGFLTVATFLFSALTQVLFRMKENVYDSPLYRDRHRDAVQNKGHKGTVYAPLRRFKTLLLVSISAAFITAVAQLAVLWIDKTWVAVVCLVLAVVTLALLALCVGYMWQNLRAWLKHAEAKAEAEEKHGG